MNAREIVLKIHETPHKAVLAITGGGAEAIGEVLKYGGGSNTLLEAIVPYDQKAFNDFVKGKPDKYCSPGAARDLAMAAYHRAVNLAGTTENIIGIGCTCSLMKDHEREGREHHAYIAVQTKDITENYDLNDFIKVKHTFFKGIDPGIENRSDQESLVANAIILTLARASKIDGIYFKNYSAIKHTSSMGTKEQVKVISGEKKVECFDTNGNPIEYNILDRRTLFPGSFRPWHIGHARIASKIYELTGKPVNLEITVRNVDKPAINYTDLQERLQGCLTSVKNEPWMGNIFLTNLSKFADKAGYFCGGVDFIIGWDTLVRIGDWKYGDVDQAISYFKTFHARFHVFHRIMNGVSTVDDKTEIHPKLL